MNAALLYLILRSTRNRILFRLRRLRQPRYAIASAAGLLYYFFVFRPSSPFGVFTSGQDWLLLLELVGSVLVFLAAALMWVYPGSRTPALTFTRADVQWLFPAPLARRHLIYYRIVSLQPSAVASSLLVTLLLGLTTWGGAARFFLGFWLAGTILDIHLMGVSLSRRSLGGHGFPGFSRQWAPLAVVSIAALVLIETIAGGWPRLAASPGFHAGLEELQRLLSQGGAAVVLWPARALVRVPVASSAPAFAAALPPALILLALNLLWVIRSDAAFEEASAERAEKLAAMRGQGVVVRQSRSRRAPFRLSPTGPVEVALLWKNVILLRRRSHSTLIALMLPLVAVGVFAGMGGLDEIGDMAAMGCFAFAPMLLLFGPVAMRNDLRHDLANLAILKTWPVRGASIVRGETLAPSLTLSVALAVLLAAPAILASREILDLMIDPGVSRLTLAAGGILVACALATTQVLVQNALALIFPAWTTVGDARAAVEMMGHSMLLVVISTLALTLSAVPAVLAGGIALVAAGIATGSSPILVGVAAGAMVLFAECAVAAQILGRVLERTDVTAVRRPE